jgi:molecular chaperone GrpE
MDSTDNGTKQPAEQAEGTRVQDRRRFDAEGNLKEQVEELSSEEVVPPPDDSAQLAMQRDLDAARKRVDELARGYQALLQDREDFKQRLTRERERLLDVERANVAQILLDVLDQLDLSLRASADDSPLTQGVRLIRDGILQKLQASGIERLDLLGKPFDPNVAEAADMEVTTQPEDDQKVVSEVRAGYRLKDRVIRPARVKVAKYMKPVEA